MSCVFVSLTEHFCEHLPTTLLDKQDLTAIIVTFTSEEKKEILLDVVKLTKVWCVESKSLMG